MPEETRATDTGTAAAAAAEDKRAQERIAKDTAQVPPVKSTDTDTATDTGPYDAYGDTKPSYAPGTPSGEADPESPPIEPTVSTGPLSG